MKVIWFLLPFLFGDISAASAATRTWNGNSSDLWSNPSNWSPNGLPGSSDDLVFPGSDTDSSNNNLIGLTVRSLRFIHGHSISGNSFTIIAGITVDTAGSLGGTDVTITPALTLSGFQTFQAASGGDLLLNGGVNLNGQNLTFNVPTGRKITVGGVISGAGNLFKIFGGTLELNGATANTYSGFFSINRGLVRLNKQLGNAVTGTLTIGTPTDVATVQLLGSQQIANSAPITIYTDSLLDLDDNTEVIGSLTLRGNASVAATNIITRNGGTLFLRDVQVPEGRSKIVGLVWLSFDVTFDCAAGTFFEIEGQIGGVGGITKEGLGDLSLYGDNTFTGPVLIDRGTLFAGGAAPFGATSGGVTVSSSPGKQGILELFTTVTGEVLHLQGDYVPYVIFVSGDWAGPIQLEMDTGAFAQLQSSGLAVLSGPITGAGDLMFLAYDFELSGNTDNSYNGWTYVKCQSLRLNKSGGARPFAGSVRVGEGFGTNEVRWLADQQLPGYPVVVRTNGVLNLNGHFDDSGSIYLAGRIETGAGRLDLTGFIEANPLSSGPAVVNGNLGLPGNQLIQVLDGPPGCDLQINAVISGGGLSKTGSGELCLNGANTYAGVTSIGEGILTAGNHNALGSTGGNTIVDSNATLRLASTISSLEPLTLTGTGFGGTMGALNLAGGNTVSGNISLTGPSTIRAESSFAILAGTISGIGPLTKTGPGILQLGGGGGNANTYSGDTVVSEGTLVPFKPGFVQSVPGNLVIGGGLFAPAATARLFQHYQIRSNVTVNATGVFDLNGFDEDVATLTLNGGGDVQTGAGTLLLLAGNSLNVVPQLGGTARISGRLGLNAGNHNFNIGAAPLPSANPDLDLTAIISQSGGTASLTKSGSGNLRLAASNTFGGNLNINAGTVTVANNFGLGTTNGSTAVNSNGVLALQSNVVVGESFTLDSSAVGAITSISGSNTLTGSISLARDTSISVSPGTGYLVALNEIDDVGGITMIGPGTLRFLGTIPNTYGGLTVVSNGMIEANRGNIVGVSYTAIPGDVVLHGDPINDATAILRLVRAGQMTRGASATIREGGLLDMITANFPFPPNQLTLRRVQGEGRINLNTNTSLTISNDVSFDFAGVITGSGSLVKRGISSLVMQGDSPFFTGSTTIYEGRYRVQGSLPNSPVSVMGGSLRGDGQVGNVTVFQNASIAPDSKFPAQLAGDLETSSLTNLGGGIVDLEFYGENGALGGNDSIVVSGPVNLSGGLSAGFKYAPREGDVMTLIHKTTAGPIIGTFNTWPQGTTKLLNEIPAAINYAGGDGNDVTLTVTNLSLRAAGYRIESGNGDGIIDRDECNLIFLGVQNRRSNSLAITRAELRCLSTAGTITMAQSAYPAVPPLGIVTNLTPFQLRTSDTLPCGVEGVALELQVTVTGEGTFAIPFILPNGDCSKPGGGGCESCTVVAGQFSTNTPTSSYRLYFVGAPSDCFPTKPCPGSDPATNLPPTRYLTHSFTNSTTNDLCVTVRLRFDCTNAPVNALGVAAYLDTFAPADICQNYLGDIGFVGPDPYPPFSFRVPASSNFVVVVTARNQNIGCNDYALEVFGLPCPSPTLQIAKDAGSGAVRLHWSTASPGWQLQSANSANGPPPLPFQNVSNAPAIVGGRYSVTNPATGAQRIYRLAK